MSIEAMKLALVALEQIKQKTFHPAKVFAYNPAIITLRQAIAEAEKQEPVAWMRSDKGHINFHSHPQYLPLYTHPPARKPLTMEQLHSIREHQELLKHLGPIWAPMLYYFCAAIERAHGIGE